EHDREVFDGVDPERGARGAPQRVLARRAERLVGRRVEQDREPQPEAGALIADSANVLWPISLRVRPPGRWFVVMNRSVRGDSSRAPLSSPPLRSMWQNCW